jgi:hypothetical protein
MIFVCYACYPQNRGDPERFGNEKFSSRCVRTAALRAIQSLLESTCPYPDRPQTRTAALRAIQSLLESTCPYPDRPQTRTAALRAIQSLLESTCPYPDRPQTRTAALRAIQSLLESTPPGRGAGAGVGSGGLSHEELELSDMGSVRLNVRLNALF